MDYPNQENGVAKSGIKLDPRVRFVFFILLSIVTFTESNHVVFAFNSLIAVLLYMFSKKYKAGFTSALIFLFFIALKIVLGTFPETAILVALEMIIFIIEKMAFFFIIGYWVYASMQTGDFLSAMQSLRLPKGFIITFSVIFRYAPTVGYEFWYIKKTMKLRGIEPSFKNIITHPIKTIEYAIVPLIIRSMTIADRLSASAMTRGLDLETKRSSYNIVKLRISDYLICALVCTLSLGSTYFINWMEALI